MVLYLYEREMRYMYNTEESFQFAKDIEAEIERVAQLPEITEYQEAQSFNLIRGESWK